MIWSPLRSTLFPYTTLFRSLRDFGRGATDAARVVRKTAQDIEPPALRDLLLVAQKSMAPPNGVEQRCHGVHVVGGIALHDGERQGMAGALENRVRPILRAGAGRIETGLISLGQQREVAARREFDASAGAGAVDRSAGGADLVVERLQQPIGFLGTAYRSAHLPVLAAVGGA